MATDDNMKYGSRITLHRIEHTKIEVTSSQERVTYHERGGSVAWVEVTDHKQPCCCVPIGRPRPDRRRRTASRKDDGGCGEGKNSFLQPGSGVHRGGRGWQAGWSWVEVEMGMLVLVDATCMVQSKTSLGLPLG